MSCVGWFILVNIYFIWFVYRSIYISQFNLRVGKCPRCCQGTHPSIWSSNSQWKILFGWNYCSLFRDCEGFARTISFSSSPSEVSYFSPLTFLFVLECCTRGTFSVDIVFIRFVLWIFCTTTTCCSTVSL